MTASARSAVWRGLRDDVWPGLRWGVANTGLLATRIAELRVVDLRAAATKLAREWLPEMTLPAVQLHVVMGGRAGAAAIGHDIYFDVLVVSFRTSVGASSYPPVSEIAEFFAHETHHVGLAVLNERQRAALRLGEMENRAYDMLAMLVAEGSATYFISAHRDLERMRRDPQYREHLADPERLLATYEQILSDVIENRIDGEAYEKALTPLVGSGFHSAGAVMFDAIDRGEGRAAVLEVLRDPRQLLVHYAAAAKILDGNGETPFDGALVARVARLGHAHR